MHISDIIGGVSVMLDIVLPDRWAKTRKENGKAVWLMHHEGEASDSWLLNIPLEALANQYEVALIAPSMGKQAFYCDSDPGCTWETFFTKDLWDYVHELIPSLSTQPKDQMLFGRGKGCAAAQHYERRHPDIYGKSAGYQESGNDLQDWETCCIALKEELEGWISSPEDEVK